MNDAEVDELLRGYLRGQMPHPWPAAPVPARRRSASVWRRPFPRLALAASVALLVASYLALAGRFSRETTSAGPEVVAPDIAHKTPVRHHK